MTKKKPTKDTGKRSWSDVRASAKRNSTVKKEKLSKTGEGKHDKPNYPSLLCQQLKAIGLTESPVLELTFAKESMDRKWRWDVCWPSKMLAVECHGGTHMGKSRHTTGTGFAADREKMNAGVELGWTVLEYTGDRIKNGIAADQVKRIYDRLSNDSR